MFFYSFEQIWAPSVSAHCLDLPARLAKLVDDQYKDGKGQFVH